MRTFQTWKYYDSPYNITLMAPVTGGSTKGGTVITLFGLGFHEFEGKKTALASAPTPNYAAVRFDDGRESSDSKAFYLSGSQLRCATPVAPSEDTSTAALYISHAIHP